MDRPTGAAVDNRAQPVGMKIVSTAPTYTNGYQEMPTGGTDGRKRVSDLESVDALSFSDGAGTAVVSPKTSVGTGVVTLTRATGGKYMYLTASAALRYGDNTSLDGTNGGYMYLSAYEPSHAIPIGNETALYIRINDTTGTCTVWFEYQTDGNK